MNFYGVLVGLSAFCIIGILHPVVIWVEYHWGKRIWPAFLVAGLACIVVSLLTPLSLASAVLAVLGFSLLWSIRELFEQEERVRKGWFPANPKRKARSHPPA